MAKGEAKKTNKMLDEQMATQNKAFQGYATQQGQRGEEAYGRSNQLWDELHSGYGALAGGQGLAGAGGGGGGGWSLPSTYGDLKNFYQGTLQTGAIDENKIRGAGHSTMEEISKSGGFDDATKARIQGDIGNLRTFGQTGGIDAAAQERMRGLGVFDEFSRTGGVSEDERRNLRARGNAPISAMYAGMSEDMNRARRIQGGSSGMANARALAMARDQSRAAADASLNTELGISDRVRSGRQWGAEGASASETQLQGQLGTNRRFGMTGALEGEMGLADTIAKNRLTGAGMWNQSETGIQEMLQRGRFQGASGLENVASAEAAAAASQASASASNARYQDMMRLEGLEGLGRLRGQNPGEVAEYNNNQLAGITGQAGGAGNLINMRYNAPGNNRSAWDTATGLLGAGAGIAGGLMTGGASTALQGAGANAMRIGMQQGGPQMIPPELQQRMRF